MEEGIPPGIATVTRDGRGIVHVVYAQGLRLDGPAMREVLRMHALAAEGVKRPTLADARGIAVMTLEARRLVSGAEGARFSSRVAILVGNPVSTMIGNFVLRVARPVYPTRLFQDPREAERWLLDASST